MTTRAALGLALTLALAALASGCVPKPDEGVVVVASGDGAGAGDDGGSDDAALGDDGGAADAAASDGGGLAADGGGGVGVDDDGDGGDGGGGGDGGDGGAVGGDDDGAQGDADAGDDGAAAGGEGDGAVDAAMDDGSADSDDGGNDADAAAPPQPYAAMAALAECDAGDAAWATRALTFIAGRRPHGSAEIAAIADVVALVGRAKVAEAMWQRPEAQARWREWLRDELGAERAGMRSNGPCFAAPKAEGGDAKLAQWLVSHDPAKDVAPTLFNMADLLASAVAADEIAAAYEAWLFVRLSRPYANCDNPAIAEVEKSIRIHFGAQFRERYLHRSVGCTGCHNAKYSTTDDADPAKDRYWPIAGRWEKALFGSDAGELPELLDGAHRYYGFAEGGICASPAYCAKIAGNKLQPWGIDAACATVAPPDEVSADSSVPFTFWVQKLGADASTWTLAASFRKGLVALRTTGKPKLDPVTAELDGDEAFAYLWAVRVAHQVWLEAFDRPLTLSHFAPRNAPQRDLLESLADHFVDHKLSLRALVVRVATDPLFNLLPPASGCVPTTQGSKQGGNPTSAYYIAPVFDPYTADAPDPALRANNAGDGVARLSARVAAATIADLLGWPELPPMPARSEEAALAAVGLPISLESPGHRGSGLLELAAWEALYGTCSPPPPPVAKEPGSMASITSNSCAGRCGANDVSGTFCWCDPKCKETYSCCKDFDAQCGAFFAANPPKPPPSDWIDALLDSAPSQTSALQLVVTLKDRLLGDPSVAPDEAKLVAAVLGVPDLGSTATDSEAFEAGLRRFCGVLLRSPQLLLSGAPPPPGVTQAAATPLVVGGEDRAALCAAWAKATLPDDALWSCGPAGLTLPMGMP